MKDRLAMMKFRDFAFYLLGAVTVSSNGRKAEIMSSKLPSVESVWGVPGDTSTWMRVNSVDDMIKVSSFVGHVQWFNPRSHIFPPTGYVRIDRDITAIVRGGKDLAKTVSQQYESGNASAYEVFAEQDATLHEPFTVEWLCEIGGRGHGIFTAKNGERFSYSPTHKRWTLGNVMVPKQPKTRGDVLAWLNVLGIEPMMNAKKFQ